MPPLPSCRVTKVSPFSNVGIDYFGTVFIKHRDSNRKAWVCMFVCMFVCMATRALHMKLVADSTAAEFFLSFRYFAARYGTPTLVVSDNAPHFKIVGSSLTVAWKDIVTATDVILYSSKNEIGWKFIIEFSLWMGGFYETLVGLGKGECARRLTVPCLITTSFSLYACWNSSGNQLMPIATRQWPNHDVLTPKSFVAVTNSTALFIPTVDDVLDQDFNPIDIITLLLSMRKKGHQRLDQFWSSWQNE